MSRLIPDWHLYFTLLPIFKSLITQSGETFLTLTSLGPEKVVRRFCIVPLSSNQTRWTLWPPFFVSTSACCATNSCHPRVGGGPHRPSLTIRGSARSECGKSQFTLRQFENWLTILQLDNRDLFYAGFLSTLPSLGLYSCMPIRSLDVFQVAKLCISSVLISWTAQPIYIWPFVNIFSFQELHQGIWCRLSFFSGCLEEQPRSLVPALRSSPSYWRAGKISQRGAMASIETANRHSGRDASERKIPGQGSWYLTARMQENQEDTNDL